MDRGFSFVEIMIAALSLSLVMLYTFNLYDTGSSITLRGRNDILALQHASNLLAYAHTLGVAGLPVTGGSVDVNELETVIGSASLSLTVNQDIFNRSVEVTAVKPWKQSYRFVTVTVSWEERDGSSRELSVGGLVPE